MEEEFDYYDSPPDPEPAFSSSPKKGHTVARVFVTQLILCVALLASLGGMKFMIPATFEQVKGELLSALSGPSFQDGAKGVWDQLMQFIDSLTPLGSNSSSSTESSQSEQSPQSESSASSDASSQPTESSNAQDAAQTVSYPGNLIWPVTGPITSGFGERENPLGEGEQTHHGIDIAVCEGTPVAATDDGEVDIASSSETSGNFIQLNHENGYASFYAHCSELLVSAGDHVRQGDIIAKSGSTGEVTGPHLHFGIKYQDEWIDPTALLPQSV